MFPAPHYREQLSLMLSEVLDEIGVNEQNVMRRRKLMETLETISTITARLTCDNMTSYFVGSKSEGTSTLGFKADADILVCANNANVIQDLSEWEHGKVNYLMIQDENTTPGYCFLQMFRSNEPMPATEIPNKLHISERKRIMRKNTMKDLNSDYEQHGPSITTQGQHGFCDKDIVIAFPCKSWPQSASGWLERQGIRGWPTHEMRRFAARTRCFVVPVGSKVGIYPELEWRISTSLAERCLMFSLNITQIRCFVLLKMILKSFLNPHKEINLSSFMIKTVLLHCIENTEPSIWVDNNLLTCMIFCLQELHSCVQNEHCSHFIISENNLMAGKFTSETIHELSENISYFIQNDRYILPRIDTDDFGYRLKVKLNMVPQKVYDYQISLAISVSEYIDIALSLSYIHLLFLKHVQNKNIEEMNQIVTILAFLMTYERLKHTGLKFLAPLTFTTYGSALASSSFGANNKVLRKAMNWLSAGLDSDVSSGRLKLASVFYSIGEMEKAAEILRQTEQKYLSRHVLPICSCPVRFIPTISDDIARYCNEHNEDCFKHITAFCVLFIRQEINCVPRELQYEMFRSTQDDIKHRDKTSSWYQDCWMDWVTIDSLPFLYFLQYKIYVHLKRQQEKQQALNNLIRTTFTEGNLKHRETALNILGQCMEQENRPRDALQCYIYSLQERARNNAANIHTCRLLSRLLVAK